MTKKISKQTEENGHLTYTVKNEKIHN